jgi:hypothetical protein
MKAANYDYRSNIWPVKGWRPPSSSKKPNSSQSIRLKSKASCLAAALIARRHLAYSGRRQIFTHWASSNSNISN